MEMDARSILDKLVSFPTVSRDGNLELINWVADYLDGFGIESTIVPYGENKAQLYANIGPDAPGGVVLSGHTDVVPVDGQDWVTDPWQVVEKDGRLFGRGTCDMKGFDALALAAVPLALERGIKRPLQIALSRDEEIGCVGAPEMIDHMVASGMPRAELAIIGEPSRMKAVTGHKGGTGYTTHIHGFEVHSSIMHTGVSAIHEAAKLITWANEINAANQAKTPSASDTLFDPPWTTAHVGMINGGTANNITAKDCSFMMTFRVVPGENPNDWLQAYEARVREVETQMQSVVPDTKIELTPAFNVPGLKPEENGAAEALVRKLTGDNATHVVSYGTEAGQFQERGYSSVICGPGDIAQAHQPNEYLELSEFQAGWKFMENLVDHLAA